MVTTPLPQTSTPAAKTVALKPIVFATDFSSASEHAFQKAIEMARKEGTELIVAHVYEPPASLSHSGVADDLIEAEIEGTIRKDVEKKLELVLAKVRAEGVRARGEILAGHAPKRLGELVEKTGAALLILGTHGRTGLKKLVVGSVASQVVATAPCPVLTVR
jgi:nucleotide-binding universal stress UspA family protein